jgi:hypothetical protein
MIVRTQRAALERRGLGASGDGVLWLNEAAPSLHSNIPQTALVATLDTYDLFRLSICCSVILTPPNLHFFVAICQLSVKDARVIFRCHFEICLFSVIDAFAKL